jgi:hypothetical protein
MEFLWKTPSLLVFLALGKQSTRNLKKDSGERSISQGTFEISQNFLHTFQLISLYFESMPDLWSLQNTMLSL